MPDTLLVPIDADGSERLAVALYHAAGLLDNVAYSASPNDAIALRRLADSIDDARTAAGLDTLSDSYGHRINPV